MEVKEGEVVCLIGPSGSGKSTFLRCLNKLEEPTGGVIIVDDYDLMAKTSDINKIRENIGMVFQQFNLFPHLSVLQNIMLAPVDRKRMTKEQAEEKAKKTAGSGRSAGKSRCIPRKPFRRSAAACSNCTCAGNGTGYHAF